MKSETEKTIISVEEIWERYKKKQPLTKDEFLYGICCFNPDYDSPSSLFAYLERYETYKSICEKESQGFETDCYKINSQNTRRRDMNMKIYVPKTEEIRKKTEEILAKESPDKMDGLYPLTYYMFLNELSEGEFRRLDAFAEEWKSGNVFIYDDGTAFILHGKVFLHMDDFTIVEGTDFAVTEKGDCHVVVSFPDVISLIYYQEEIPVLNDIFTIDFFKSHYDEIFSEKEYGILCVQVQSQKEGKEYYYDVVSKTWYFARNIESLEEERAREEKEQEREYSLAKKCFKIEQRKKMILILVTFGLMVIANVLNKELGTPLATIANLLGAVIIVLALFDRITS